MFTHARRGLIAATVLSVIALAGCATAGATEPPRRRAPRPRPLRRRARPLRRRARPLRPTPAALPTEPTPTGTATARTASHPTGRERRSPLGIGVTRRATRALSLDPLIWTGS